MLKLYKLSDHLQDIIEAFDLYKMDSEIYKEKKMDRDSIEQFLEGLYTKSDVEYRRIKRKATTSYIMPIYDEEDDEVVDVKLTIRFDLEGNYLSHRYYNINFNEDFEFIVEG